MVDAVTTGCPPLESLAAFVDRRLDGAERAALVAHLALCERCYEIVAEVLHTADEIAEAPAGVETAPAPLPFRPRFARTIRSARPIIAAIAAMIVVAVVWRPWEPPGLDLATLTAELGTPERLEVLAPKIDDHEQWRVFRGAAPPTTDEDEAAFKSGVRLVDLAVALDGGDPKLALPIAADLENKLAGLAFADMAIEAARGIRERLADSAQAMPLRAEVLEVDAILSETLSEGDAQDRAGLYLRLGRWAQATRLAILAERPPDARDVRRSAAALRRAGFPAKVDDCLAAALALAEGGLDPGELEELAKELGELVESGVEDR